MCLSHDRVNTIYKITINIVIIESHESISFGIFILFSDCRQWTSSAFNTLPSQTSYLKWPEYNKKQYYIGTLQYTVDHRQFERLKLTGQIVDDSEECFTCLPCISICTYNFFSNSCFR